MARGAGRVTLVHNRKAGDGRHCRDDLIDLLARADYRVSYVDYKRCDDLSGALDATADLIAVAGGDGTIAKVAAHARPNGPPIGLLPLGTANNIAKSLALDGPLDRLVAGWSARRLRPVYAIEAAGPWGRRRLFEGLGFGAFEQAIVDMPKKADIAGARRIFAAAALNTAAEHLDLDLDSEIVPGPFALLEISTVPLVGPNLALAAAANPAGPEFTICLLGDDRDERQSLSRWIAAPEDKPAPVSLRTAVRATITGRFRRVRLNGHIEEMEPDVEPQTIRLAGETEPLHFLVPA